MDRSTRNLGLALVATAALTFGATGCSAVDDDCGSTTVMFFSTVDRHYHYGSPTGKVVPAGKVPPSARKVPGYKAPAAPKTDMRKPGGSAPKAPKPAPSAGRR